MTARAPEFSSGTRAAALAYLTAGFSVIPLFPGSKLSSGKWKRAQVIPPTVPEIDRGFSGTRNNVGLVLGRVSTNAFALDFDDRDLAHLAFDLEALARETLVQATPRGFHVLLRTEGAPIGTTTHRGHGLPLDVKGERGYIVAAPSVLADGGAYRRLSPDLRVAAVDRREVDALIACLEGEWPAARCVRRHCELGQQRFLEDYLVGQRQPSTLRLASFRPTREARNVKP